MRIMSNPIAGLLAEELIKIYSQHKLPNYAGLNAASAEGFTQKRIKSDPNNSLFQMIILAAYDRTPFTRWAGGFEPIWGLGNPKESLPDILRTAQLFTLSSVLDLEEGAIDGILTRCFFYGHHLASYGAIRYATTFKRAADLASGLLSDIRSARTAADVKRFHSNLDSIPGIGETIASKLVMYTFRELPYFGSSIHPRELYPAVKPILKEYHNANLAGELKNHYGNDIVEEIFEELKGLGDPFAIDALYYVDRDEPGLKTCLLRIANCKETEMGKDDSSTLAVALPPQKMELLKKIAKDEYDVDKCTLVKIWIIERLSREYMSPVLAKTPIPLPSGKSNVPTSNVGKMKQIIQAKFNLETFTKKALVKEVRNARLAIPNNQISPHDWSVNTDSGKRRRNSYLIHVGAAKYKMLVSSDGYQFLNGVWVQVVTNIPNP